MPDICLDLGLGLYIRQWTAPARQQHMARHTYHSILAWIRLGGLARRTARIQARIVGDLCACMRYTMSDSASLENGGREFVLTQRFPHGESFDIRVRLFRGRFPCISSETTGHRDIVVRSIVQWVGETMNAVQPRFVVDEDGCEVADLIESLTKEDLFPVQKQVATEDSKADLEPRVIEISDSQSSQDSQE